MRPRSVWLASLILFAVAGCNRDAAFCSEASGVRRRDWTADPAGLSDALRSLDPADVDGELRPAIQASLDQLRRELDAFVAGAGSDGWSTEYVADWVNRACGTELGPQAVVP